MENNFEQYELLLGSAAEAAEACLDMEGGAFLLAWTGELIRELAAAGYFRSARLTAQKLCESVGIEWTWMGYDELTPEEKSAWLNLFTGSLMDHLTAAVEHYGSVPPDKTPGEKSSGFSVLNVIECK